LLVTAACSMMRNTLRAIPASWMMAPFQVRWVIFR
jgi:hypothetical protein